MEPVGAGGREVRIRVDGPHRGCDEQGGDQGDTGHAYVFAAGVDGAPAPGDSGGPDSAGPDWREGCAERVWDTAEHGYGFARVPVLCGAADSAYRCALQGQSHGDRVAAR